MSFRSFILYVVIFALELVSGSVYSNEPGKKTEGPPGEVPSSRFQTLSDFNGTTVASLTGTIFSDYIDKRVANVTHLHFNDYSSMTEALRGGKIDAIAIDEPVGRLLVYKCPDVVMFQEIVVHDTYGFAFKKGNPLRIKVDRAIETMRRDGTLDQIASDWFDHPQEDRHLPTVASIRPDFTGEAGVFRFGHDQVNPPMSYVASNETRGSDVELALRIATALDMEFKCVPMNFDALIEAVQAGKVDMVGGSMSITKERQKSVDFSVPYYNGGLALLVLRSGKTNTAIKTSLMDSLVTSFNRTFIDENRYMLILKGLWVTVLISVMAAIGGTLLAFFICMMRRSSHLVFQIPARLYIRLIQGIPTVVLLMILYYVVFGNSDLSAVSVAIIGFAINFAAYVAEILRAAIDAVPKGQKEAAQSLGYSRFGVFRRITFPQAVRHALPVYKGELISMMKTTSIVGYIAIHDLTKMTDIIRSRTYEAFFPLLVTAAIYFIVAFLLMSSMTLLERRIDPRYRKRRVKGVVDK